MELKNNDYGTILEVLAKELRSRENEITLLKWRIESLETKLEEAEKAAEDK